MLVSSVIVCLSFMSYQHDIGNLRSDWTVQDRWVFMLSSVSIILSFLGVMATIFPQERPVCRVESILVWCVLTLWSIGSVSTIINPFDQGGNGVTDTYVTLHPSVFFFSILCLITSVVMLASWYKEYIVNSDSSSVTYWILLAVMSFFTLVSSFAFRNATVEVPVIVADDAFGGTNSTTTNANTTEVMTIPQCQSEGYDCKRVNFAICLSAISAACCSVLTPWRVSMRCQIDVSLVLFFSWFVGSFVLTTTTGPATNVGTLYFSIWICVFLSLHLLIVVSTYDSTVQKTSHDGKGNKRTSVDIGRAEIFEVAYNALEVGRRKHTTKPNRSDSYKDLFAPSEDWVNLSPHSPSEDFDQTLFAQSQQDSPRVFENRQIRRLELWSHLMIASCICLASLHLSQSASPEKVDIYGKVALSVPAISVACSSVGIGTALRTSQTSKVIEGVSVSRFGLCV
jgi:hypothetical protein